MLVEALSVCGDQSWRGCQSVKPSSVENTGTDAAKVWRSVSVEYETIAADIWGASSSDVIHADQVTRPSSVHVRDTRGDGGPRTSFLDDTSEKNSDEASSSSSVDADARPDVLHDENK